MDLSTLGMTVLNMVLPAIWAAVGPMATIAITAFVNNVVGKYVPRPVQLILASVISAITAGLTGSVEGIDPSVAVGVGATEGLGIQAALMINPKKALSSAPPEQKS